MTVRWARRAALWQLGFVLDRIRPFLTARGLVFVLWAALAGGDLFADALREKDASFATSVSIGLWIVWAAVLIVIVVPGAAALVAARTAVPAAVPATLVAYLSIDDRNDPIHLATIAIACAAALVVLSPPVGEHFVDSASYGDERRYLLRSPAPVLVGLLVPTWAVCVLGLSVGPLALADQRWLLGIASTLAGLSAAAIGLRALYRLAQRWLVFVPAGLVVHDHVAITEPVLLPRGSIGAIGPARADTTAIDLTARASGLALELRLNDPVKLSIPKGRAPAENRYIESFLIAPTRPGAVMAEARRRRMSIG